MKAKISDQRNGENNGGEKHRESGSEKRSWRHGVSGRRGMAWRQASASA